MRQHALAVLARAARGRAAAWRRCRDSRRRSGRETPGGPRRPGRGRGRRRDGSASRQSRRRGSAIAPRSCRRHAGDGADERGLAGAVGADDGDDRALVDVERHVVERLRVAVEDDRGSRPRASHAPRRRDRTATTAGSRTTASGVPSAIGDAVIEHEHVRGERHHRAHHVLDQQDGQPAVAVERRAGSRPCGRSRSAAGRPSPRRAAAAAARWRARARPRAACGRAASGVEASRWRLSKRSSRRSSVLRARCRAAPTSRRCSSAPTMTLSSTLSAGNGRTIWKVRAMPRRQTASGAQAVDRLAGEGDRAAVRRQRAGDHVEHRGLAGAVGADDGEDRALPARRS